MGSRQVVSVRHAIWALLVLVPGIAFVVLYRNPANDPTTVAPEQHFHIVSIASVACFALAVLAVRQALKSDSARIYLISLGFLTMAGTFAVHGLATPGVLLDTKHFVVTGFSARIAIWFGALFFAASVIDYPPAIARGLVRARMPIFAAVGLALVMYCLAALRFPESVPPRIMSADLFLDGTFWSVLAFSGVAAVGYARLYVKTGEPIYGAVAVGALLMAEAQVGMHIGGLWRWSWWMYHLQLLGAFATMLTFPFAAPEAEEAGAADHSSAPTWPASRLV